VGAQTVGQKVTENKIKVGGGPIFVRWEQGVSAKAGCSGVARRKNWGVTSGLGGCRGGGRKMPAYKQGLKDRKPVKKREQFGVKKRSRKT